MERAGACCLLSAGSELADPLTRSTAQGCAGQAPTVTTFAPNARLERLGCLSLPFAPHYHHHFRPPPALFHFTLLTGRFKTRQLGLRDPWWPERAEDVAEGPGRGTRARGNRHARRGRAWYARWRRCRMVSGRLRWLLVVLVRSSALRSVCLTPHSLLVAVQDPPSLRVIPYPTPNSHGSAAFTQAPPSHDERQRRGSGWEGLPGNLSSGGDTEAIVLDEWKWLIGRDRGDCERPACCLGDILLTPGDPQ